MKKLILIASLLLVTAACKKENVNGTSLTGTWELRVQFGGIAGLTSHFPPGNNHILKLNTDSTFAYSENSSVLTQGTFSIVKNGLIYGQEKFDGIYYNHNNWGSVIRLSNDTLKIGLDYDDGMESDYVRR